MHDPILITDFHFEEMGYSRTFKIHPKHCEIYDIGAFSASDTIPTKPVFNGEVLIEIFYKNEVIIKTTVNSIRYGVYVEGTSNKYKFISFDTFFIPLDGKYTSDISLRITVLKSDHVLTNLSGDLKLFVAVSGLP